MNTQTHTKRRNMNLAFNQDYWALLESLSERERRSKAEIIRVSIDLYAQRVGLEPATRLPDSLALAPAPGE